MLALRRLSCVCASQRAGNSPGDPRISVTALISGEEVNCEHQADTLAHFDFT